MKYISAEDWELLSFFGCEPQRLDPSAPWIYDESVYVIENGELLLSFSIHPAYRDVKILLQYRKNRLYEFEAKGVNDVKILQEKEREVLEITLSERQSLWIQTYPLIQIIQTSREEPMA